MRADDAEAFVGAFNRLRILLQSPDIRAERSAAHDVVLVEGFGKLCSHDSIVATPVTSGLYSDGAPGGGTTA